MRGFWGRVTFAAREWLADDCGVFATLRWPRDAGEPALWSIVDDSGTRLRVGALYLAAAFRIPLVPANYPALT